MVHSICLVCYVSAIRVCFESASASSKQKKTNLLFLDKFRNINWKKCEKVTSLPKLVTKKFFREPSFSIFLVKVLTT